jgi:hypothetical protein
MNEQQKLDRFLAEHSYQPRNFFARPHWTRRQIIQFASAGLAGTFLTPRLGAADGGRSGAVPKNTAKNVIFVLLQGAPSHTDTFDLKFLNGTTPPSFQPDTVNGVLWPTGLMPNLGQRLSKFAIVRSVRSHAVVHTLSQVWVQIGRNPTGVLGNVAPHIGSIVAAEKDVERQPGQNFPTFLSLNATSNIMPGAGYMQVKYGPFKITADPAGIPYTSNPNGDPRLRRRMDLLNTLDGNLRQNSPDGVEMEDFAEFYLQADGLMHSPAVNQAFTFSVADSARYGNSGLGNAFLVASQVLKAQQGTRFIQVTSTDGWDMHQQIYSPNNLPAKARLLDNGLSALLDDLEAGGLLSSTLIVMMGEFGRTVGPLTGAAGRDHYPQQFAFFAGGGVKGGTVVGTTDSRGSDIVDAGWSRNRYVYTEDIEATIYSALGIDWTYVRQDDPLHRGFEYVPFSGQDLYGPVHELWG